MSYNESLRANSNYPLMTQSQWDNAPFNQVEPPEKDFDVTLSYTLSKDTTYTTNYYDEDENGYINLLATIGDYEETEYGLPELIEWCQKAAQYFIDNDIAELGGKRSLKAIKEAASGWTIDDREMV